MADAAPETMAVRAERLAARRAQRVLYQHMPDNRLKRVYPDGSENFVAAEHFTQRPTTPTPATAPAGTVMVMPCTLTPLGIPAGHLHVDIIGLGGTGGRLASMIVKQLRQGDTLHLWDPDTVGPENLNRQHFNERQLGRNKAEAIGQSIASEAKRVGVNLEVHPIAATRAGLSALYDTVGHVARIVMGCVDSRDSRAELSSYLNNYNYVAWIDSGNERRGGQVILSLHLWPMARIVDPSGVEHWDVDKHLAPEPNHNPWRRLTHSKNATLYGLTEIVPDIAKPDPDAKKVSPDAAEACAMRIDAQTIPANILGTAYQMTMFSWLVDGLPFSQAGFFYSTLGPSSGVPIRRRTSAAGGMNQTFTTLAT